MIEWILSSSILIAVITALRYLLKGRISLRLQYALWGLVLLRLLFPFHIGSSSLSVMNALPDRVPETVLSDDGYTAPESAVPAVQGESEPNIVYNHDSITDGSGKVTDWGGIVKAVWLAGMAVVGLWLLISNLRLAGKLKRSRQALACAHCKLPVYLSDAVDTPCLFGLFRPSIYVTSEAAESKTRLRHIVAHEMTHRRHGDNFWAVLRGVCLALHWYNPLVWWAAVLSRNDAELACDEATIKRIGEKERAEYGRTLIAMTCQKRPALLNTATTMTGGKNSIKERLTMMVKKPKTAVCTLIAVVVIAAVAVGCTFTGAKDSENTAGVDNPVMEVSSEPTVGPTVDLGNDQPTIPETQSQTSDSGGSAVQNEGVTISQAFMTEDDEKNFVIENPAELRSFLSNLEYHSYTCDGLPEYDILFDDGTTYHVNLSSRWVWQGSEEKEADLSEDLLAELQTLLGIELCAYPPISVIQ